MVLKTIYFKNITMPSKYTLEDIIKQSREIHGDKYDYSLITEYKNDRVKYPIICPEHGVFYKSFNKHIHSEQGCPMCVGRFRYNTETFIKTVEKLDHCKNYTFEKLEYKNNKTKVIVTCHEKGENGVEHGDFTIAPGHLLSGEGCPICRYIKSSAGLRRSIDKVIEKSNEVHNNKYDYSLIKEYKNDRIKYPIVCPEHGIFYQTFNNHIKGRQGCPICGQKNGKEVIKIKFEDWVTAATQVHNGYYTYHKETFDCITQKTKITCPKHGDFWQNASNHLHLGHGCPKCASFESVPEKEIYTFICGFIDKDLIVQRDRSVGKNVELDIFIPSKKFAIEFDGLYWHCEICKNEDFHLNKTKKCEESGIHLFHIFEDEWMFKKDIVKSMIKNMLGFTENRVYARNCEIKEVDGKTSREFLNNNHIQGYCHSAVKLGLYYNNELVSLMTFGKSRHFVGNGKHEWELLRFCNKLNMNVVGGASRLLKHFINEYDPKEIVSYADRRWSTGSLYDKIGFEKYNESKPNYYYIIKARRVYRFNMRKSILVKKYGCPKEKTEREFCYEHRWYRIYDCGCFCYLWKKQN